MKKFLTVALSTAMAFSMFASVAFGADAAPKTTQEKFDSLKAAGIFEGFTDGTAGLDQNMTRGQFAKVIAKLLELQDDAAAAAQYTDVTASNWAAPYIGSASKAGLLNGQLNQKGKKVFLFNDNVTVEQLAKVLVVALKLDVPATADNGASKWAQGYVAAAVKAGLIPADAKFKGAATRAQLVEAAFTAKGLVDEAKKPVVVNATKVESVKADNLKEIKVVFDGSVDEGTAETVGNYTIDNISFKSATLADDKKTVTLLLADSATAVLKNQQEYKLSVDNILSADKSKTISQDDVKFSPLDNTVPTIASVTALGTKAFKVTFSEPVKNANITSNFKVDGSPISGSAKYVYTDNAVIISTGLTVGDHKLVVSGVQDYNNFTVLANETSFAVAEDKAAPEIVSAKTVDLTSVELEFNEPVKSVSKAYHTSSGKTGTFSQPEGSTKLTIDFSANKLSLAETTVYLEGVTDFSGNTAKLEVKVVPTLDTERPTVTKAEVDKDGKKFTVTFSEKVTSATAQDRTNYVVKDKDGKVVAKNGLDTKGNPIVSPTLDSNGKAVTFTLNKALDAGTYTLEVSGVQDTATVANTMLPSSTTVTVGETQVPSVSKAWYENTPVGSKYDSVLYIQFSKDMAVDGDGNVLVASKYAYNGTVLPKDSKVELVASDTVKITFPRSDSALPATSGTISLVASKAGVFAVNASGQYTITFSAGLQSDITVASAEATANDTVKVKFDGKLTSIDANDFFLETATGAVYFNLDSNSFDDGKTVAVFKLTDGKKLPANASGVYFKSDSVVSSQDNFGAKVKKDSNIAVTDKIGPETVDYTTNGKAFSVNTVAGSTYVLVKFNEAVQVANITNAVKVKVNGDDATVNSIEAQGGELKINFTPKAGAVALTDTDLVEVSLDDSANSVVKAVYDGNNNAAKGFALASAVKYVK